MSNKSTACKVCKGHGFITTGGWHFSGEPWDDVKEIPCPRCATPEELEQAALAEQDDDPCGLEVPPGRN